MSVVKFNPPSLAAPPENKHAHIVIAPSCRTAYIAGQVALDKDWNVVGAGDHGKQAEQCFRNIADALSAIDASPEQIVEMTIIVVDYDETMMAKINSAGEAVFGADWPVTATTLIGAKALGHAAFLVEIKVIVALFDGQGTAAYAAAFADRTWWGGRRNSRAQK